MVKDFPFQFNLPKVVRELGGFEEGEEEEDEEPPECCAVAVVRTASKGQLMGNRCGYGRITWGHHFWPANADQTKLEVNDHH